MTLSGNNTYAGLTTVNGRTLLVNGSQPKSHVAVAAAGALGGCGVVEYVTNILGGVVPEADYERAHRLFYSEREDEL